MTEGKKTVKQIEAHISEIDKQIEKLTNKKKSLLKEKDNLLYDIKQKKGLDLANKDWDNTNFKWSERLTAILKIKFNITKLRPFQLSTMNAVLSKHDCILIMPTGGGKSLSFQAPALVCEGVTVVVSPLISLMEDQCMALKRLGINAEMLNSGLQRKDATAIQKQMIDKSSPMKLLYVTPEKLAKSKQFMSKLQKMYEMGRFAILAIDEVHCCSHWGHDFRPDYKFLGIMKRQFPKVPILGLTATATSDILKDVQKILAIESSLVFKAEFNRPNLKYEVRLKPTSMKNSVDELVKLINQRFDKMSGIIYCCSVNETVEVTKGLQAKGIRAANYHAQLEAKVRSEVHHLWTTDDIQIIVATIAFGMGIDKPNVRFVIHHTISKSLENYYQESGRAGRDDNYSECILYYRFGDMSRQSSLVFTEQTGLDKLYNMITYCIESKRCRRSIIADYFGISTVNQKCNSMCDNCTKEESDFKVVDVSPYYQNLCSILDEADVTKDRLTGTMLVDAWYGKSKIKFKTKTPPQYFVRQDCERIIAFFITQHYFEEDFHFTPYATISYVTKGSRAVKEPINLTFLKSGSFDSNLASPKAVKKNNERKKLDIKANKISEPINSNTSAVDTKKHKQKTSQKSSMKRISENNSTKIDSNNKKPKLEIVELD